jgi:23S rRNA G2069 N7-methylase RlmK/C1962 C5-methylase RlmI
VLGRHRADLFHKIVASAGSDAGVDGYITERLGAAPDHPMTLAFPEGEYLKGLVVANKKGRKPGAPEAIGGYTVPPC